MSVNIKFTNGLGTVLTLSSIDTVTFDTIEGGTALFHSPDYTQDATLNSAAQLVSGIIGYGANELKITGTFEGLSKTATTNGTIVPDSGKYLSSVVVQIPVYNGSIS